METIASILHADLDAFYASVEQLLDPSLRGKPIAVGGGVVLAASYEAKAFGVRGGMPGRQARGLCPQLIFVNGHFKDYQRLRDAAIEVVNDFTPLVERISIDEAFADVAGCTPLFGPPAEIARQSGAACGRSLAFRSQLAWRAPSIWRKLPRKWPSPTDWRSSIRHRIGIPSPPAGRADVGSGLGHQSASGRDRRAYHRAAGKDTGMVARAVARSRGERETRSACVESRFTGDQDSPTGRIGMSAVGDR